MLPSESGEKETQLLNDKTLDPITQTRIRHNSRISLSGFFDV